MQMFRYPFLQNKKYRYDIEGSWFVERYFSTTENIIQMVILKGHIFNFISNFSKCKKKSFLKVFKIFYKFIIFHRKCFL